MKLITLAAIITSVAALVGATPPSPNCSDSITYGHLTLTPSSIATFNGEILTVSADLSCTLLAGITPTYIEYCVKGDAKEPPVLLSRHSYQPGSTSDSITVPFPDAPFSGTSYVVELAVTYDVQVEGGVDYAAVGTSQVPINIA